MPEGHTIHREAQDQHPMLVGQRVTVTSPQGRFTEGAARIDGDTCVSVEAFGKHLLYGFAAGETLHIHLGLHGKVRKASRPASPPQGAVRVRIEGGSHVVDINGPNCCELLDPAGVAALLGRIGPDVLRPDADPELARARIGRSRTAIGLLLMDQSVLAGIGNIYRTEILWRQRLHPLVPGRALDPAMFASLWADAAHLLAIGVRLGAIVTVDDAVRGPGRYGARTNIFAKENCPRCAGAIALLTMAGRRAFACPTCQPMP